MKRHPSAKARGISLVELLIVIAILSLLMQLIIPAVQQARESARRTQCFNNMRQVGLGMQNYESAHNLLPPGWVREEEIDHNYVQFILPYIGESAIYDQYDFSITWKDPQNDPATKNEIPLLRCPTAPRDYPYTTDYAIYLSIHEAFSQELVEEQLIAARETTQGALQGEPTAIAKITDGLSNTIFLCEDAGRRDKYWFGGRLVEGTVHGSRWATPTGRFEINVRCTGQKFRQGSQLMNCTNSNEIFSFHPQGANFLFGDASVRFLLEDVDADVLVSMLTASADD